MVENKRSITVLLEFFATYTSTTDTRPLIATQTPTEASLYQSTQITGIGDTLSQLGLTKNVVPMGRPLILSQDRFIRINVPSLAWESHGV